MIIMILAALLAGVAVACLMWGMRHWFAARYQRDVQWMRETYLRFHPEPINAELYTLFYYAGFVLLLLGFLAMVPSAVIAVGFWIVTLFLPRIIVEWAWKRRLKNIDLQISQCVTTLANSMRAGLTLVQAITRLSEQAPDPIKSEFKIMANQYGYGADMETVLRNAKERLGLPNFTLFASALLLNREMGGDISETLTRISKSLDKLREMQQTVEAHTSEGRTNIKVMLVAGVFMLLLLGMIYGDGVLLLVTTIQGIAILMIAAALAGTGAYLAYRITKSEI